MTNPSAPPMILHVVYRFDVGGLENGVVNLINRLPHRAWRHGVLALTEVSSSFRARIARDDTLFLSLGKGRGHLHRFYPQLHRLFRQHRPAIVHTRNLAALEAVVPAWLARVPARVHGEHGRDVADLDGASRRYRWVRRAYGPFVSRYVALSQDLARYLVHDVGVATERVEQIYNGVDTERFHPSAGERPGIEGCPFNSADHWLVGTVGRLEAVKDQTNLARAFVSAIRGNPEAGRRMRLVMVGSGALRAQIEQVLDEAQARELAWLPGERHDVADVMRGLDCFVLPSRAEGISNTILEAMASGLPLIATRVGGNAELMEEGVTGRLVARDDSEALARDMLAYFADPRLARRHGRAGRSLVERRFSLERMIERYHDLYSGLVSGQGRAQARAAAQP